MRRKRLGIVSLVSLIALVVLAVGISASTGSASTEKATKGHKIFFLPKLIGDPDPEKSQRVMQAMLSMKKIEIDGLERAAAQA